MKFKLRVLGLAVMLVAGNLLSMMGAEAMFLSERAKRRLIRHNQMSNISIVKIHNAKFDMHMPEAPDGAPEAPDGAPEAPVGAPEGAPVGAPGEAPVGAPGGAPVGAPEAPVGAPVTCPEQVRIPEVDQLLAKIGMLRGQLQALQQQLSTVNQRYLKASKVQAKRTECKSKIALTSVCAGVTITAGQLAGTDSASEMLDLARIRNDLLARLAAIQGHLDSLDAQAIALTALIARMAICDLPIDVNGPMGFAQYIYNISQSFHYNTIIGLGDFDRAYAAFKAKVAAFIALADSVITAHHPVPVTDSMTPVEQANAIAIIRNQVYLECSTLHANPFLSNFATLEAGRRFAVMKCMYKLKKLFAEML